MPTQPAVSPSTPASSRTGMSSAGCACTRPGCKAETLPATRTASPDRHPVLQAVAPLASDHAPAIASGLLAAGAGLVAAATVAGVWLARRRPGQQQVWLGAAAGALLVIAGVHVLPDAWSAARAAGVWPIAVPATAIAAFLLAGFVARGGCACQCSTKRAGGRGAAAALALHRFLEGSA